MIFFSSADSSYISSQTGIYSLWVAKSLNNLEHVLGKTAAYLSYILHFCKELQDTWSRCSPQIFINSHSLIFQRYSCND